MITQRRRGPRALALVALACVSMGLATASPALAGDRVPSLSWSPCPQQRGFECATARVPLDHRVANGPTIRLAVIRHRAEAPSRRVGTLFLNPGGPGAAKPFLSVIVDVMPEAVRSRFDIVTWDPRGFGESTAVHCFASQAKETRFLAGVGKAGDTFPVGADQMTRWIDRYAAFGRQCDRRNATLLRHVSTAESARDLDLLRRAVGSRQLNYYGNSYGTFLGATYANLFPGRVRAMVLGSNTNPKAWIDRRQGAFTGAIALLPTFLRQRSDLGARKTLNAFLDLCGRTTTARCSFSAGSAPATRAKFDALLRRVRSDPSSGPSDYADLVSTVGAGLYSVGGWADLATTLEKRWTAPASSGARVSLAQPRPALVPAPTGQAAGTGAAYDSFGQFLGVVCGESPNPGPAAFPGIARFAFARSGPISGGWTWLAEPCATWPATAAARYAGPWNRRTANPVLVLGITHDPATPYEGAVAMSRQLARARLLTVDGYGHGTFGQSCTFPALTRYLLSGALPPPRTRCRGLQPFQ